MRAAIAIVLALILLTVPALAQNGTITGVITSGSSQAVPDALVTLTDMDGNFVAVPDNPQFSSNGTGNNVGVYTFYEVPPGTYNVTAEKGDSLYFAIATVDGGTASNNIVLPNYTVTECDFPSPVTGVAECPRPYVTFVPATFGRALPSASSGSWPFRLTLTGPITFALLVYSSR